MNVAIFYDTETTGFPLWSTPSDHPDQPNLVQLAACLVDLDAREIISSMDVIIKPDGWGIPEEASNIHGISTEMAELVGIEEEAALTAFADLIRNQDGSIRFLVAHNESFDARIMRIAFKRQLFADWLTNKLKNAETFCTMHKATKIVQCPPTPRMIAAGRTNFKNPNLGEAYKFFTGKDLEGAHNAMVDVKACIEVYFGILDHNAQLKMA